MSEVQQMEIKRRHTAHKATRNDGSAKVKLPDARRSKPSTARSSAVAIAVGSNQLPEVRGESAPSSSLLPQPPSSTSPPASG